MWIYSGNSSMTESSRLLRHDLHAVERASRELRAIVHSSGTDCETGNIGDGENDVVTGGVIGLGERAAEIGGGIVETVDRGRCDAVSADGVSTFAGLSVVA